MKQGRTTSLLLLVLALATSPLFANGGAEKSQPGTNGKTALKMIAWDVTNTVYLQPLIDAYTAKHPNVSVSTIDIPPNHYNDKLFIMLAGGDDSDLISVKDIPGYAAMVNRDQIVSLNPYIKKDEFDLKQYSGITNDIAVKGQLYALPFRSDFWILYYNKDLFDQVGVPYPTNDMTWQQYAALARRVAHGSGTDRVYGTHYHMWRSTVELPSVQDGKHSIISTDYSYMKPYYDMVLSMQKDHTIMDFATLKVGNIHYSGLFYNQKIAMLPMGTWFISTLISKIKEGKEAPKNMRWGLVKYPHPEGVAPGTTAGTLASLAINANSKHKQAAWDFLKFFCGPDGAKILAKTGNFPAIRNDAVVDILSTMDGFPTDANSKAALKTSLVRLEMPMNPKAGRIDQILQQEHELIMTGSVSVDKGLAEMSSRVAKVLAEK